MRNKAAIGIILFAFVILAAGCQTAKGLTKGLSKGMAGMASGVGSTVKGTAEGMGKDGYAFWRFIQATDNWVRENLW